MARLVPHMALLSGAHRPNSLAAISECVEAGVERIEIDVHSLSGADWAVTHDHRLELSTHAHGAIGSATPEGIRAACFRDTPDQRIALLSEVVDRVRGSSIELQLDLKDWRPLTHDRVRALLDVTAEIRHRVIVSSGQDWNLNLLHRADPGLALGFDPGHYIDHALEETPFFLPRTTGAYGYRDDHPLGYARAGLAADYLERRFETFLRIAPWSSEYFLSYRLVTQMLDDGFDVAGFLHAHGIDANVWTLDYHDAGTLSVLRRMVGAGIDRITTNTALIWQKELG